MYKIEYSYDGKGEVFIEAQSLQRAKEKFFDGEYEQKDDHDLSTDYFIDNILLIKE